MDNQNLTKNIGKTVVYSSIFSDGILKTKWQKLSNFMTSFPNPNWAP